MGALASPKSCADTGYLLQGYQLCATTEGKSPSAINIVTYSVNYLEDFLAFREGSTDVTRVTRQEIRAFVLYLKQKRCFSNHRFNHTQDKGLSGHTINCYLRSIRIFFSWLVSEDIIATNPFDRVKIPRPSSKVVPTFSDYQIQQLLDAIDTRTAEGYRDYAIILTLLDTGLRISELCNLKLGNLWLDEGMLKVLGKGNKERLIPVGKQVQRLLWRYINRCRPEPAMAKVRQSITSLRDSGVMEINSMRSLAVADVKKLCRGLHDDIERWGDMRAEMGEFEDELKLARYFGKLPLSDEALSELVEDLATPIVIQYLTIALTWCREKLNPKLRPPREITKYYSIGEYTEVELADVLIWALVMLVGEVGSDKG